MFFTNKHKYLFLLISFFALSMSLSCRKNTKSVYEDRLTRVPWILTELTISEVSVFSSLALCVKDNIYTYGIDGTYKLSEGAKKCNPSDPIEKRGTWSFSSDKKTLFTTGMRGEKISYQILTLEKDDFALSYTDSMTREQKLFFKPVQ